MFFYTLLQYVLSFLENVLMLLFLMTLLLVREQMVTLAAFEKENKEKNRKLIKTKQTQKWQEET